MASRGSLISSLLPAPYPFYNLREEAQFLADVIKAAPRGERVLWGFDREIFSDRYLISKLEAKVPQSARQAFTRLKEASTNAWARCEKNPNAEHVPLCAGAGRGVGRPGRLAQPGP